VATSGDYRQFYSSDYRHHHIIDPRTGRSAPRPAGVTVLAPTAMLADALATAAMVLEPKTALDLVARYPGCCIRSVTKAGQEYLSPEFSSSLI